MPYARDGQISTDPLDGGIEITEEQYAVALDGILSGKVAAVTGGELALIDPPSEDDPPASEPLPLPELKLALKADIDWAAERERGKYITPGSGQAMTYMQKSDEARRYLALDGAANEADYPLIAAEVGITAPTIRGVAEVVNAAYIQWQAIGAAIEAVRLAGKAAIDAAETEGDARAAATAVSWP